MPFKKIDNETWIYRKRHRIIPAFLSKHNGEVNFKVPIETNGKHIEVIIKIVEVDKK